MIDIFIDDDNKVTIKTTNGLTETEVATTVVLEAMRNLKKPEEAIPKVHVLYLQNCGDAKLQCVKAVKNNLILGLKEAKDIVDECVGRTVVVLSTGLKSKMDVLFNRFDPSVVKVKVIDDKEWV